MQLDKFLTFFYEALRNSIDCGGGVVDADYRGPVGVILFNHGEVDYQGIYSLHNLIFPRIGI